MIHVGKILSINNDTKFNFNKKLFETFIVIFGDNKIKIFIIQVIQNIHDVQKMINVQNVQVTTSKF